MESVQELDVTPFGEREFKEISKPSVLSDKEDDIIHDEWMLRIWLNSANWRGDHGLPELRKLLHDRSGKGPDYVAEVFRIYTKTNAQRHERKSLR